MVANASETLFAAVIEIAVADTGWLVGFRADNHHLASADRCLFVKTTALRILLARSDVLISQVHAFDNQHLTVFIDGNDFAFDAFVFAANHNYRVVFMDFHRYFRFSRVFTANSREIDFFEPQILADLHRFVKPSKTPDLTWGACRGLLNQQNL